MVSEGRVKARAIPDEEGRYALFIRNPKDPNGKPQVSVKFDITSGPDIGYKEIWYGKFSTDGSTDFTIKALRAIGLQGDDVSEVLTQKLDREVELVLAVDPYDNKVKIKFINEIGGGGGISKEKIMSKEEVRGFAALLKMKMGAKPGQKTQAQQNLPTADDSDAPPF